MEIFITFLKSHQSQTSPYFSIPETTDKILRRQLFFEFS